MQRSIILALVFGSAVGALGNECAAGTKHKKTLTNLLCNTDRTDATSCPNCCEVDDKTCGGLTIGCDGNHYSTPASPTTAELNAWKALAATEATKLTACCTARAKCASSSYTCPAGKKKDSAGTNWATRQCSTDAASCGRTSSSCCVDDKDKCGTATLKDTGATTTTGIACLVPARETIPGTGDGWKNMKIYYNANPPANPADATLGYQKSCCLPRPTCASTLYTCKPGTKKTTTNLGTVCTGLDPSTCITATTNCCVADTSVCAGRTATCAASRYQDANLGTREAASVAAATTNCCTAKATCAEAKCPAGYMRKANTDKTLCSGNADSCTTASCCEKNPNTCGGLSNIVCATGYYNENLDWSHIKDATKQKAAKDAWANKNATEATKNTNCCSVKAACTHIVGTTTPAAVVVMVAVTTTPAAPALKFSEHKVAIQDSDRPWGMNMVWLAVGGFIGMGVLMAVQGFRSRKAAVDLLDNDSIE